MLGCGCGGPILARLADDVTRAAEGGGALQRGQGGGQLQTQTETEASGTGVRYIR
jgi:hypothetical protein